MQLAIDRLSEGFFSGGDADLFKPLVNKLLEEDPYFVLADFLDYAEAQEKVGEVYRDQKRWTKMSILNAARVGKFSSDRSIRDYCRDIWHVDPVNVQLADAREGDTNLRLSF